LIASTAHAQTVDLFRNDPIGYFSGRSSSSWVGSGAFFQTNYTDTLHFGSDSTGAGLSVRRVLVNADKGVAISRGTGHIIPVPRDSIFAVRWSEKSYPAVNGVMRWQEGQWVISFDGEWKEWSIRVRQDEPGSVVAAAARMIPGFRPVELTAMTYRSITR
jgi:hypothetical protein